MCFPFRASESVLLLYQSDGPYFQSIQRISITTFTLYPPHLEIHSHIGPGSIITVPSRRL